MFSGLNMVGESDCMNDLLDQIHHIDAFDLFPQIYDGSIDLIATDPPYGITANEWDRAIDIDAMWVAFRRMIKPTGAIVMTSVQPFATDLIAGCRDWFKYEIIWQKTVFGGFVHAKNKPMRVHENILVFSPGTTVHKGQSSRRMTYNIQMEAGAAYSKDDIHLNRNLHAASAANLAYKARGRAVNRGIRYPTSILKIKSIPNGQLHPTQKPIPLMQWLIRAFSNEGELVLDPFCGVGTTGVAAAGLDRRFICGDMVEKYVLQGRARLAAGTDDPNILFSDGIEQMRLL